MKKYYVKLKALLILLLFTSAAHASTVATQDWEKPLQTIMNSLTGFVAYAIAGIALGLACLGIALNGELQGGMKRVVHIVIGVFLAFDVVTLLASVFHYSGAVIN